MIYGSVCSGIEAATASLKAELAALKAPKSATETPRPAAETTKASNREFAAGKSARCRLRTLHE
jgi:hypothetical protein